MPVLIGRYQRLAVHRFVTDDTMADDRHIWTQSHWQRRPQSAYRLRSGVVWQVLDNAYFAVTAGIFGPACDNDAELRGHDV